MLVVRESNLALLHYDKFARVHRGLAFPPRRGALKNKCVCNDRHRHSARLPCRVVALVKQFRHLLAEPAAKWVTAEKVAAAQLTPFSSTVAAGAIRLSTREYLIDAREILQFVYAAR